MKHLLLILLTLVAIAPAHASEEIIDTQYYTLQRGTCQKNNVERTWNRWFGDKQKNLSEDTCCMESVAAMEKTRGLVAKDGVCPEGTAKKSLECPTSKVWCERVTAGTRTPGHEVVPGVPPEPGLEATPEAVPAPVEATPLE
jgi:hypothetical protein